MPTIERACARGRRAAARPRRHRGDVGPGPGGRAAGRAWPRPRRSRSRSASRSTASTTSRRTSPSTSSSTARCPSRRWRCSSPAATPRCCWCPTSPTTCAVARLDDRRRGGRGVRQGGARARAAVPRRPAHRPRWRARATGSPSTSRAGSPTGRDMERHRFDFSFSGSRPPWRAGSRPREAAGEPVPVADVAASFQEAVVDVLTRKAVARLQGARRRRTSLIGGGVAANSRLRAMAAGAVRRGRRSPCACRGPGCAPTTARWSRRSARRWCSRAGRRPTSGCRPTPRCRSPLVQA